MSSQDRSKPARRPVERRQTLPHIPSTPTDEERDQQGSLQQQQRGRESSKKYSRSSSSATEPHDFGPASGTRRRRLQVRHSGDGQLTAHFGHATTSVSGLSHTRGPNRRLGRTPSSPSVLLSKVKERIREKVSKQICYSPQGCLKSIL